MFSSFLILRGTTYKTLNVFYFFCLLLSPQGFSFVEDRVGNGGELSERQLVLTYAHFSNTLTECLSFRFCPNDLKARTLTQKIQSSFQQESKNSLTQLQFLSARLNPEIFGADGTTPLWITKPEIGATIYVNTDKLSLDENNRRRAISPSEAFRMLFVALGTHQNEVDLLWLDSIAFEIFQTIENGPPSSFFHQGRHIKPLGSPYLKEDFLSAETWLTFFYTKMSEYLKICLAESHCTESQWQKNVLGAILNNMNRERSAADTLRFESGQANPALFTVNGVIKSAVTGLAPGHPIFFNLDYLYLIEKDRELPLSTDVLLSLLIHELGHHAGVEDHASLDLLGQSVARHFEKFHPVIKFQEDADMGYFHKPALFRAQLLNGPKENPQAENPTKIYLADELYFYNFNPMIEPFIKCSQGLRRKDYRINSANWTGKTSESEFFKTVPYDDHGQKWYQFKPLLYGFLIKGSLLCINEAGISSIEFLTQEIQIQYSREYRQSELGKEFSPSFHYIFDQIQYL
jgi:hypothetical protein